MGWNDCSMKLYRNSCRKFNNRSHHCLLTFFSVNFEFKLLTSEKMLCKFFIMTYHKSLHYFVRIESTPPSIRALEGAIGSSCPTLFCITRFVSVRPGKKSQLHRRNPLLSFWSILYGSHVPVGKIGYILHPIRFQSIPLFQRNPLNNITLPSTSKFNSFAYPARPDWRRRSISCIFSVYIYFIYFLKLVLKCPAAFCSWNSMYHKMRCEHEKESSTVL